MNHNTSSWLLSAVAVLLAFAALFIASGRAPTSGDPAAGGIPTTGYDATILAKGGIRIGGTTSQTTLRAVEAGTCTINKIANTTAFNASTTEQFYCAVSGVTAGDKVLAMLPIGAGANPSGAGSLGQGFAVIAAFASTTGSIGFTIANNSGAATSSFAQATSGVQYFVFR